MANSPTPNLSPDSLARKREPRGCEAAALPPCSRQGQAWTAAFARGDDKSVVEANFVSSQAVRLFFPFAGSYVIMEFGAYLSYRGIPVEGAVNEASGPKLPSGEYRRLSYCVDLTCGGARPAARSSAMICCKHSMPYWEARRDAAADPAAASPIQSMFTRRQGSA